MFNLITAWGVAQYVYGWSLPAWYRAITITGQW